MPDIPMEVGKAVSRFIFGGIKKLPGATRTLTKSASELAKTTGVRVSQRAGAMGSTTSREIFGGALPPGLTGTSAKITKYAWKNSFVAQRFGNAQTDLAYARGIENYTSLAMRNARGAGYSIKGKSFGGLTDRDMRLMIKTDMFSFANAQVAGEKAVYSARIQGVKGWGKGRLDWVRRNSQPNFVGRGVNATGRFVGRQIGAALTDPGDKGRRWRKIVYATSIGAGAGVGSVNTINALRHQYNNNGLSPSKVAAQSVVTGPGYNSWMKMPGRGMSPNNLNTAGLTLALNSKRHSR